MKTLFILSGILVIILSCLIYQVWHLLRRLKESKIELEKAQAIGFETLKRLRIRAQDPLLVVPAAVVERINALETENATLRVDNETGLKTILNQIQIIKDQKSHLERLIGENRRFIHGIKRK
jgi:hypothetical protein